MDIYELLNKAIVNKRFTLSSNLFTQTDRETLNKNDMPLFDILKNISSLGTKIHNSEIEFHPMFTMADGKRTFSIEDLTDDDYKILESVDFQKTPLILRALVADILWTQKKKYNAAKIAAEAYWELAQLWKANSSNLDALDMLKRAICISTQTNQAAIYSEICTWFDDYLIHSAAIDTGIVSLRIMELFAEQKDYDVSSFLPVLDNIILSSSTLLKVEQAYKLKAKCLYKLKKNADATISNISLAKYYVHLAESNMQKNLQGVMEAESLFQKAIILYRYNGESELAEKAHRRLVEIQKEIPKNMVTHSFKLDVTGVIDNIVTNMEGLSFEESIIRLTQMIEFEEMAVIKSRVIEKQFLLQNIFTTKRINAQGQTILTLPPLDIQDPEKDPELLEMHMHRSAYERQQIMGDIWVKNGLSILRNRFTIDNSMLEFLTKDNPIIPQGRERIFQSAITMFLNGNYFEAIHIFAPQMENLFRNIAKEVGGLTVTLDNDGSSMEKVLSSIFNLPELLDCYDNNILFIFKGLLNEQAGANIRNLVAHGIISEADCFSGACLYFGVAVIKLLVFTSNPCYKLLRSSEKLKYVETPNEDALKVVH